MADLHLSLLGPPTVRRNDAACAVPASLQSFLGYLALDAERGCHKEQVIASLWPDAAADAGRRRLNTAVWRARRLFDVGAGEVIVTTRSGHLALDHDAVAVDVVPAVLALSKHSQAAAERGDAAALDALRAAVTVEAGRFLAGNYDEWTVQARHRLELSVISGVETLLATAEANDKAIAWAELLVGLDPLREDAHRRLIRLYADAGRRADALAQYDACVRHLRDELGVEPLVETTLVATAVREGIAPPVVNAEDPRRALCDLRAALASCQGAVERIESALASLPND